MTDLTRVSEFQSKYNNEFMKPIFYKEKWATFCRDIACDKELLSEHGFNPNKEMYYCRLSANGYMDQTDWMWDESLEELIQTVWEMYPAYK